jgi:hypothetical protein
MLSKANSGNQNYPEPTISEALHFSLNTKNELNNQIVLSDKLINKSISSYNIQNQNTNTFNQQNETNNSYRNTIHQEPYQKSNNIKTQCFKCKQFGHRKNECSIIGVDFDETNHFEKKHNQVPFSSLNDKIEFENRFQNEAFNNQFAQQSDINYSHKYQNSKSKVVCFLCSEEGHMQSKCPKTMSSTNASNVNELNYINSNKQQRNNQFSNFQKMPDSYQSGFDQHNNNQKYNQNEMYNKKINKNIKPEANSRFYTPQINNSKTKPITNQNIPPANAVIQPKIDGNATDFSENDNKGYNLMRSNVKTGPQTENSSPSNSRKKKLKKRKSHERE